MAMVGITVTERAAKRIKALVGGQGDEAKGLRLKVVGGGCSGLQYKMDIDAAQPGDRVFERDGARVVVDIKSLLFLNGTELDYEEGIMESGFRVNNPNVKRSCGCGASFGI